MSFGSFLLWSLALAIFTAGIGLIVYYFIIAYQLVDRRNQHFERQSSLFRNVLRILREHCEAKGLDKAGPVLDRAQAMLNDSAVREPQRNPWIWAVVLPVLTLGLAGLYTWWFLTVDYRRHSVRQREFVDTLSEALRVATDRGVAVVDESVLPDRNFWVYLLLSIVTFGLFGIYWQYVLFNDPNQHFAKQAFAEDQIVSYLRSLA